MTASSLLPNRVALITGAGSGVGRSTALRLGEEGVRIALMGRTRDKLEQTAENLRQRGCEALVLPGDVGNEYDVSSVVQRVAEHYGGIDFAIHAAGIGRYGPVETYSLDNWNETLATNLTGAFLLSRAVVPWMRLRGGGAIIAVASGAAKTGYPQLAAYAASKFGLLGFMQSLAGEVGGDAIKVSTVLPGSILTDFGSETAEQKRQHQNGKKYLLPEDIADAICFLLLQPDRAWTQELNIWPV